MSLDGKTLKVCSCNRTVALDAKALASALKLKEPLQVHDQLCRRDVGAFQAALGDPDVIVACTQEAPLFGELAAGTGSQAKLQFVNVREQAGWSNERAKTMPKIAALVAMAALPEAEPAPAVEFKSAGQVLIIGPAASVGGLVASKTLPAKPRELDAEPGATGYIRMMSPVTLK